ncbi:MAG: C25 family cysteine peptidase, partial [Methanosarcinaceae archaeon]|nr:C25 family cysteine peptidase [Methanosarcinaceae archaeon]
MKKIISIFMVGIVVLGGLGAAAFNTDISTKNIMVTKNTSTSVLFPSQPILCEKNGFIEIEMSGATSQLLVPNKPVLPIYVKTYQIPFGSKNIQITCTPKNIRTMTLTKEVMPAHIAPLSKMNELQTSVKDESVYNSAAFYPNSWYTYDLGAGRNSNDQEVIFVKVICHPIRYSPANNQINYANGFNIDVTYCAPPTPTKTLDTYDLLIIAPAEFESIIQPLVDHKNSKGVETILKNVEDILSEYDGVDEPEQIKYFIKYAYDNWGIK